MNFDRTMLELQIAGGTNLQYSEASGKALHLHAK